MTRDGRPVAHVVKELATVGRGRALRQAAGLVQCAGRGDAERLADFRNCELVVIRVAR